MSSTLSPWRRRLSELGRGTGKPHPPLFAPLLYGVAGQIDARAPAEVTADPTRLGKCLVELRRALGTDTLVMAAPTAMEAEALGAEVDRAVWPPRITAPTDGGVMASLDLDTCWARSEALSASLETCKRLSATQPGEPVLLAALTGPASLLSEILASPADAAAYDLAGRALSALARQFAQAGASALLLCERVAPADPEAWRAALNTVANIARFHRIPALLAFDADATPAWPATVVACPYPPVAADARPQGLCVDPDPATWSDALDRRGAARVIVTAREVAADTDIESLIDACSQALDVQRED